jgi:hypothetical protein
MHKSRKSWINYVKFSLSRINRSMEIIILEGKKSGPEDKVDKKGTYFKIVY